jgi:hypothetical protein
VHLYIENEKNKEKRGQVTREFTGKEARGGSVYFCGGMSTIWLKLYTVGSRYACLSTNM